MRLLAPLRTKVIALLWGGLATSSVGDQLGTIAITWIAVGAFGTAAGYLAAAQAGVTLLAAIIGLILRLDAPRGWEDEMTPAD